MTSLSLEAKGGKRSCRVKLWESEDPVTKKSLLGLSRKMPRIEKCTRLKVAECDFFPYLAPNYVQGCNICRDALQYIIISKSHVPNIRPDIFVIFFQEFPHFDIEMDAGNRSRRSVRVF